MSDPYVYAGTDVLRNLRNIRTAAALETFERRQVNAALQIETHPSFSGGVPDEKAFRDIHKALFGKVYDWAGQTRTVDIAKESTYFCRAEYIDREMRDRFAALARANHLRGLDAAGFAARAAEHISEINAIHPFREGNGRTMTVYLQRLARYAGHDLDLTRLERTTWIEASRAGMDMDYKPMTKVIADALLPGRAQAQTHDQAREQPQPRPIAKARDRDDGRDR